MSEANNKRNGYFVAGIVVIGTIASMLFGLSQIVSGQITPVDQRVTFSESSRILEVARTEKSIDELKDAIEKVDERERAAQEDLATMREHNQEIETQFDAASNLSQAMFQALEFRVMRLEEKGNERHDVRIQHLEDRLDGR